MRRYTTLFAINFYSKRKLEYEESPGAGGTIYPKPGFSYPCLAAMALMNSELGNLSVSGFYNFVWYAEPVS